MASLDTNLVLRLILNDIPEHTQKAVALLDRSAPRSLHIADPTMFECVWILSGTRYQFSRADIASSLLDLMKLPQLTCNKALFEKALPLYVLHPKVSLIDICLTLYAELNDAAPLLTFDRRLAEALPGAELL